MPDWRRLVGRRLRRVAISPRRRDEIAREMAGFLEDRYEERLARGDNVRTGLRQALAAAGRWPDVVRELERVEGLMTSRLRSLWLPGVVVSVMVVALLRAVAPVRGSLIRVPVVPHHSLLLFWPWLLALPLLGAAGAAWSRSQGGRGLERLMVVLFPALVFLALYVFSVAVVASPDGRLANANGFELLLRLLNWVMLPAVMLLLGGLPVLHQREAAGRGVQ